MAACRVTIGTMPANNATEQLRTAVRADWDAAVNHPFVRELHAGTLPRAKMRRYLVQDYQFVDAFTALLGAAVACADATGPRMVIARQLGIVAGGENTYFQRAFDTLGVPDAERSAPRLLPCTVQFSELLNEARASLDYPLCLTVLTVAEWLYLDWARQAPGPLPADPVAREWIEIHDNPDFRVWVEFLRGELDRILPGLPPGQRERCERAFARATKLERDFFEATYL